MLYFHFELLKFFSQFALLFQFRIMKFIKCRNVEWVQFLVLYREQIVDHAIVRGLKVQIHLTFQTFKILLSFLILLIIALFGYGTARNDMRTDHLNLLCVIICLWFGEDRYVWLRTIKDVFDIRAPLWNCAQVLMVQHHFPRYRMINCNQLLELLINLILSVQFKHCVLEVLAEILQKRFIWHENKCKALSRLWRITNHFRSNNCAILQSDWLTIS